MKKTKNNQSKKPIKEWKLNIMRDIKIAMCFFMAGFLWLVIAMKLDTETNISTALLIFVLFIIAFVFTYIAKLLFGNWYNPLCTYKVDGKIISILRSSREQSDGSYVMPATSYRVLVSYKYKEKEYKRIISDIRLSEKKMKNIKVKVKLCKWFPKMINIKEELD